MYVYFVFFLRFKKIMLDVLHLFIKLQTMLANSTKMPCRTVLGTAWNLEVLSGRSDNVPHGSSL